MIKSPYRSLHGLTRSTAIAFCLPVILAGCLQGGPGHAALSDGTEDPLAPGVTLLTDSEGEISFVRTSGGTTIRIAPERFPLEGEFRQYAIRAPDSVDITLQNTALSDGWGGEGGCALVHAHYPAPFAKTLVFSHPTASYHDDKADDFPSFGQLSSAWGGGGTVKMRVVADDNVVIDDGIQIPRPPLIMEPMTLGHRGGNEWTGHMEAGSWLLLLAGGFSTSSADTFEWTVTASVTGDVEVYRLPPTPIQCGLWANDAPGSTDVTVGIYSVARDLSMSMRTNTASTLYLEHESREIMTDPTSTAIHKGHYEFLGAQGGFLKDSSRGERSFVHCFASTPGDIGIHFDEVTGSSTVLWLLADTAFLPFSREPVCGET